MAKYTMTLDLNVLNHLGLNLYSNTPSVLSEVIANSHDADALEVRINILSDDNVITIVDDGIGMSLDEINEKFLRVGYQKRENGESLSKKYKRPVMGRKGIGKLSLLSIANTIDIHSIAEGKEGNALRLSKTKLQEDIQNKNGTYEPEVIDFVHFGKDHGTKIIITDFERGVSRTPAALRTRLAKRFTIKQRKDPFQIYLNDEEVTINDRKFFKKVEFLWPLGDFDLTQIKAFPDIRIQPALPDAIDGTKYRISGWIASVDKPSDLKTDGDNNNIIGVMSRGKLAQEDILSTYNEGGIYATYLIGEIHADFLDIDKMKDIATSNRQQYNENDERYQQLQSHVYKLLKIIQGQWTDLRNTVSTEKAIAEIPELQQWRDSLTPDTKKTADKLFATIENLHFDKDKDKKKEVYKFGILAFERLRVKDKLSELEQLPQNSLAHFGRIFSEIQDIEASLYYDIASQRVEVVKKLNDCCDNNEKERVIQQHIFENLWLINPAWDRATAPSTRLEQSVTKEFGNITNSLSDDEKKGRIDIRYKTATDKHIIIELKRYIAGYKITPFTLAEQVAKYTSALKKCLGDININNPHIECICIVGPSAFDDLEEANKYVSPALNTRIITYDLLIENAIQSYDDYLETHKEVGRIRKLIESL